ncbi:MAG: hypothetical protein JXP34_03325 [Planctomycetes bacterium]|nr:hypothetical protein [Planctomycetota bacterium]
MFGAPVLLCLLFAAAGFGADAAPPADSTVRRETRVFDIQFLTEEVPDFPLRGPHLIGGLLIRAPDVDYDEMLLGSGGFAFGAPEEGGGGFWEGGWVEAEEAASGRRMAFGGEMEEPLPRWTRIEPKALVDLIRRNIAEDSWANQRNSIDADPRALTVRQTPNVLDSIEHLLASLRARRARMVSIEIAIVPLEALDEETTNGSPFLSAEAVEQALARAGDRGTRLSFTAYDGQTVSRHIGTQRALLRDCEVNQTGVSPVINPVVSVIPLGYLAEVRADAIADTEWTSLHVRVFHRALVGEPEVRKEIFGEFELAPISERGLSTSTIVRAGEAVFAGFLRGDAASVGSLAALIRVRPLALEAGPAARAEAPDGLRAGMYDVEFLLRAARAISPDLSGWPADPEELVRLIRAGIEPESWSDARMEIDADEKRLTVYQRASVHTAIAAMLERWRRDVLAVATLETWVLRGTRAALMPVLLAAGPDGALPEKWPDLAGGAGLRITAEARLAAVPGERTTTFGWIARSYVADYENVSGGTGWTLSEVPDPLIQSAGSGILISSIVGILPGGLALARVRSIDVSTRFDRTGTVIPSWGLGAESVVRVGSPPQAEKERDKAPPARPIAAPRDHEAALSVFIPAKVDLPSQQAWDFDRVETMGSGRPILVEARSDGPGPEPAMARIVRVRLWKGIQGD